MNQRSKNHRWGVSRRQLLRTGSAAFLGFALPDCLRASIERLQKPIKIGLIADLHQDIMHDAPLRLSAFLQAMKREQADVVVQLGDFACPVDENRAVLEAFQNSAQPAMHVLGNHEIDKGHSFDDVAAAWQMPSRYYVKSISGLQLIVLDGNEKPPNHQGGYPAHIGTTQLEWLQKQLASLPGPILVFCHQPLAGPASVDNAQDVQQILAAASDKVLMTINGHTHVDYLLRTGNLMHLHVNSASYFWVGGSHRHASYPQEVHANHPWIEYTCPYAEPVYTMLTIDPASQRISVLGSQTTWVGKSPAELGADAYRELIDGEQILPGVRARSLRRPQGPG